MGQLNQLLALLRTPLRLGRWTLAWAMLVFVLLQFGQVSAVLAQQTGSDFDHAGTGFVLNAQHQNVRCETCHTLGVFKGTPKDCASCHGWTNPRAQFSVMPVNHIPTANASCESCHAASQAQFMDAARSFSHTTVSSLPCVSCHSAQNPHPNVRTNPVDATHQGQNLACDRCHTTLQFVGPKFPPSHIPTAAACTACHTSTDYKVMPGLTRIHANAQAGLACAQCHADATRYPMTPAIVAPPANHIPMNGLACENCHIAPASNVQLPVVDGARFSNASFSHSGISSGCASCHSANGVSVTFFGINNIVAKPASSGPGPGSHIPTTAACESCHRPAPAGLLPANATRTVPGTGFQQPKPTATDIHAKAEVSCATCHEAGMSWLGVDLYPRTATLNSAANTPYIGFQTRPTAAGGLYSIADPGHQSGGECDICHSTSNGFLATNLPGNHIPIAANVSCSACHKTGDYQLMPSLTDIHANAQAGVACSQCHGDATRYPMTPAITAPPVNHIAMNAQACETCHVGPASSLQLPVQDGARFSNSAFSHAGISGGCASCHAAGANPGFGINSIVRMPSSALAGASSHIPTAAACEACHKSIPAGQLPGNATATPPGTGFVAPVPTKADLHANVSVSCASCHEAGMSWMGVDRYPRSASFTTVAASYIGFQTRPNSVGGGYSLLDPGHDAIPTAQTADCAICHSVAAGFGAPAKPGNHIPTAAACGTCHKSADFNVMPSLTDIHANVAIGKTCLDCHSSSNAALYPMTPPLVAPPAGHITMALNQACESCHVGPGSSMLSTTVVNGASFGNSAYSHAGVTSGCANCHGATAPAIFGVSPKNIASLSPAHLPVAGVAACETCHTNAIPSMLIPPTGASASMTTFAGALFTHAGITASCESCHGQTISSGSFAGNPTIVVMPQSSVSGASAHIPTTAACQNCHTFTPSGLIAASASTGDGFRRVPLPTSANIHANTSTACSACHESGTWIGIDRYARTTISPYAGATYFGFQTRPTLSGGLNSIQDATPHPASGECSNCHAGFASFAAPVLSAGHIPIKAVGCAACHKDPSFSVMPAIADIHANTTLTVCAQCHASASTFPMTPPIVVPPLGHIDNPGNLDCAACHVGPNSSLVLPVANGANFGNSAYVHSGATTGCDSCHGAGAASANLLGARPKNIASLTPAHLPINSGAACEVCHKTSPGVSQVPLNGAIGGNPTFAGASFDHAFTGAACATCHGQGVSGSSFAGNPSILVMPPSGSPGASSHIPTAAACDACHKSTPSGLIGANATVADGFRNPAAAVPTPAAIHANSSASCSTCHESGTWLGVNLYTRTSTSPYVAGTVYFGFQVRPTPGGGLNSISDPTPHPVGGECSNCHVSYVGGFAAPGQPTGHIPTNAVGCAACHKDPSYSVMPATADIHANVNTTTCATCHANTTTYLMRPAIKAPPSNHIAQGGLDCQACHVGANSSLVLPVANGASFANSAYVHSGATTGCDSCHGAGAAANNLFGVVPKNIASLTPGHLPVTSGAACEACHKASPGTGQVPLSGAAGGTPSFAGAGFDHAFTTAKCAVCHGQNVSGANFAGNASIVAMPQSGIPGPGSHMPTTAACEACHLAAPAGLLSAIGKSVGASDFRLAPLPTKTNLHNNVSVGCSACHEAAMSWAGVELYPRTAVFTAGSSAPYIGFQTRPNLAGGGFSVADGSHPNLGECSNCHSVATGFGAPSMPTGHIPTTAACGACHKSADYSVMPGIADIHANAQAGLACAQCHGSGSASTYPMVPPIVEPPATHIAMGTAGCENCHVGSGSSIAALPVPDGARFAGSLFNHSGITSSCASCHGSAVSPSGFYGVVPKALSNLSPAHLPASEACETCHIGSIPTGLVPAAGMKTFAGALFSHAGISSGCDTCHGPSIVPASFAGRPNIVVMPATSPFGPAAHIPSSTSCESCHLGSVPAGMVAGSASKISGPGTGFQSPAPTSSMVHAGVTGSCATCHGNGQSWIGMTLYPSAPVGYVAHASYTGYQTRPGAGGSFAINDPSHPGAGLDCSQCHSSFASFGPPTMPGGHIPVAATAQCGNCHTNNFVDLPTVTNIHAFAQSTTANCVQCHSTSSAALLTLKNPIVTPAGDHIAMGSLSCESCHMGPLSSIRGAAVKTGDRFAGSLFNHSGIGSGCNACHGVTVDASTFPGIPNIKAISYDVAPVHMRVPSAVGCEVCHTNSVPLGQVPAAGMKTFAGASFSHSGITADCAKCHGPGITPASFLGNPNIVVMPATASGGHIPSSTVCESCHLGSTPAALLPGSASKTTGPGTGFKVALPASTTIHANSDTSSCNVCHESGKSWISVDVYTRGPSNTPSPGALFTGFQTRPIAGGGTFSVNDNNHAGVGVGDCSNCHTGFTGFGPPTAPANHIPYAASAACGNCHKVADFGVMPAHADIHKFAQSATTNCVQCHSAGNADTYNQLAGMGGRLVKPATNHIAMGALSCESCHLASLATLTTGSPTFAGGQYSHSGVTSGCNSCHASGAGPFQGTLSIIAMPPTSPAVTSSHLPTSTQCEICHLGSTPSTLLAAVTSNTAATSGFGLPVPTAAMVHTGVSGACSSCHEAGGSSTSDVWMNMAAYPITTTAPFKGFQTRPTSAAGQFRVLDAIHPAAGDCSACHTSFTDFSSTVKPANHIPTSNTATCQSCHTSTDFTVMPTLSAIHQNAPSTTTNCVQCHSATNADTYNQLAGMKGLLVKPPVGHVAMGALGCESCHVGSGGVTSSINTALPVTNGASFKNSAYSHSGVTTGCASCHGDGTTNPSFAGQTPKPMPLGHLPNSGGVDCVACHTTAPSALIAFTGAVPGSANTFETTKYSHSGITSGCQTCHAGGTSYVGITNMVVLSAFGTHIPTSTKPDCASCHLGSTPTALVTWTKGALPKTAPNTGFKTPIPTGTLIHAGVSSGCVGCHEKNMSWLGVDASFYPRTTVKPSTSYVGFQARPFAPGGGFSIADASHPLNGDCSTCHGSTTSFTVSAMPAAHIPILATATCDQCHTNISLGSGQADFSVMPSITNIHKFAPSSSTNCAQCHSAANAANYNQIAMTPPLVTLPAKHVPLAGTGACEACHLGGANTLKLPIVTGAKFSGAQYSHSGITSGCATCHGNGLAASAFTGVSNLVAIPATAALGATAHIPYTAACEACHAGALPSALLAVSGTPASVSGFRLPAPTGTMVHNGISSGCSACHESNFVWKGVDLYPILPNVVTANGSYKGFQTRPLAAPVTTALGKFGITDAAHPLTGDCSQCHTSTSAFSGVAKPLGHMPTTAPACSSCHSATDFSIQGLAAVSALHTGLTYSTTVKAATATTMAAKLCANCHTVGTGGTSGTAPFTGCKTAALADCASPPALNSYQPATVALHPTHVPIGTTPTLTLDCNACHVSVSSFAGVNMKNATMHTSVNSLAKVQCMSCHERGLSFFGVAVLKVRPSGHHTGQDCGNSGCHTYNGGFKALVKPVMRGALVSPDMGRIRPGIQAGKPSRGSLGNSFDHKGVQAGQCKTCHDGKSASGMPARHLMVATSCDSCHRPTTWLPAQFNHSGITPNTCLACHNGMAASGKPSGHFMTARSCDSCHKNLGWAPVNYQHVSPLYQASPDKLRCVSCHDTNGEIIRRQARALTRTKPILVGP